MISSELPILYSFRRCPYAMRARMAIQLAGIKVELREVLLKAKPEAMLAASAKGTVPVLVVCEGQVIDESLDIMHWALAQNASSQQLLQISQQNQVLMQVNDSTFKTWLDKYKYADRFPEHSMAYYREQCEQFLRALEQALLAFPYLHSTHPSIADYAIFPFIRQFAGVEPNWFTTAPYPRLRDWLQAHIQSTVFHDIMEKHPVWSHLT